MADPLPVLAEAAEPDAQAPVDMFAGIGDQIKAAQTPAQAGPGAGPAPGAPAAEGQSAASPGAPDERQGPADETPEQKASRLGYASVRAMQDDEANESDSSDLAAAIPLGAAKAAFNFKDFFTTGAGLWGETPKEDDRSQFRQWVDGASDDRAARTGGYSFAEGVTQNAVGLLGAGKFTDALGGVRGVVKAGTMFLGTATTSEAHEANFANLVQRVPGLSNPVTAYLASDEHDSTLQGYAKNAVVSLGLGYAVAGVMAGSLRLLKALRGGSTSAVADAQDELTEAIAKQARQVAQQQEQGRLPLSSAPSPSSPDSTATGPALASGQALAMEPPVSPSSEGEATAGPATTPMVPSTSSSPEASSAPSPSPSSSPSGSSPQSPSPPGPSTPSGASPAPSTSATLSATAPSGSSSSPTEVKVVSNPTAGGAPARSPSESFVLDDAAISKLVNDATKDTNAILKHGSWDAAIANGHTFASEDHIPWQVVGGTNTGQAETSMDAFIARVAEAVRAEADKLKGGDVQTDVMNAKAVATRAKLWNQDPGALMGMLHTAGADAAALRANMHAGLLVGQKAMQTAWQMSARIKAGDYSDWGGDPDAAYAALKAQTAVAAQAFSSANSILANSARAVRGARGEFALTPQQVQSLRDMDGPMLAEYLSNTKGDPQALAKALQPGWLAQLVDGLHFYQVNNLVSSPETHAYIAGSNIWQMVSRPAERMLGSAFNGTWGTVGRAAKAQYGYMASAIPDAFRAAVQAFKAGDSIMAPHNLETDAAVTSSLGQTIAQLQWSPPTSVGNMLRNTLVAGLKTGAFPTRFVGFQDELVKQTVYRGYVQARAWIEGEERGLTGEGLNDFVKDHLLNAFDTTGAATDTVALNEAKVATYQNDLIPGTFGSTMQNAANNFQIGNFHPLRIVLPFIKTPTNLIRQGQQLTPGLNMAQKEFRDGIMGNLGPEKQALSIGQMGIGGLLMGTLGLAAYQGKVTGSAPSDPKLRDALMQTGWRPHSFVIAHGDGTKTYIPFDRMDPIAMPMGLAADIVSVLKSPEPADQQKAEPMLQALGASLLKNITDKAYLSNMKDTLDMLYEPDKSLARMGGRIAGGFVPMASLLHLVNPDPVQREADGFIANMLNKVPGFSTQFSPRRDWGGDPISVHKGLWLDTPESKADAEIQRMALEQHDQLGAPSAKARGGADLRDITLAGNQNAALAGRNAYDAYQELAGHPSLMGAKGQPDLKTTIANRLNMPDYQKLPDGTAEEPGTKMAALMDIVKAYRRGALQYLGGDHAVRSAEFAETQRVATAHGYTMPNMPTAANTTDSFLSRMGRAFGLHGVTTPPPVAPTTGTPGQ